MVFMGVLIGGFLAYGTGGRPQRWLAGKPSRLATVTATGR